MKKRFPVRWFIGIVVVLLLSWPVYFTKIANTDVWKNLVTGRYLHLFHSVHHPSVFVTAPAKEVALKTSTDWLGTVVLFWINHYGGWQFHNAIQLIPVLIVSGCLLYTVRDKYGLVAGLVGTLLVYCMAFRLTPRASIFGLCMMPILLFIWYRFVQTRRQKWLWFIPPLMILWGSLHGSYLVGGFVFVGLGVGFLLDYIFFNYVRLKELRTLILVAFVLFLGTLFVKPAPDKFLIKYSSIIFGGETVLFQTDNPSVSSGDSSWDLPSLKNLTHDFFLSRRPYVGHEYSYTLEQIDRPNEYILILVLIPLLCLHIFVGPEPRTLSFYFGIVMAFWIGLAFQRALVYVSLTIGLLIVPSLTQIKQNVFSLGFPVEIPLRTITAGLVIFGFVWFLELSIILGNFNSLIGSKLRPYWELGFGRHSRFQTDIPEKILRKYSERNVFNEMALGGILLYEWWPQKKVFWWPKTSDLAHSILRRRQEGRIGLRFFRRENITLSVVSFKFLKTKGNPYKLLPGWNQLDQDELMTVFCKCDV